MCNVMILVVACIFVHNFCPYPGHGSSMPSHGSSGGRDGGVSGVKVKKERYCLNIHKKL